MTDKKLFDKELLYWNGTSMATGFAVSDSPISSSVIDHGTAEQNEAQPPEVQVILTGGDSAGDAATIIFALQDSADGTTGWATIATTKISAANGVGFDGAYRLSVPATHRRYTKLVATVAAADFTAGAITAGLV